MEDYEVYKRWSEQTSDTLDHVRNTSFEESSEGLSPLECLYVYDTYGEKKPCNDIEGLRKILNGKASINFHIQLWSEGIYEGTFFRLELMEAYPWLPQWVWDALHKEVWKLRSR